MKGVILAGGFGTRIQPLTSSIPKPMLPVANRPIMEYVLEKLKEVGIKEVVVLLYHQPDVIREHFRDGKRFGVTIHYILPEADYGTAGAVRKAKRLLKETFLVISGDIITDFRLSELVKFHREKGSKLSLGLYSVDNPLQFGVVITDQEGKIVKFLEKPGWGEVFSDTINTGIYVIEPEVLDFIPDGKPFDFAMDLFPKLMKEGVDLWGYKLKGYWKDVGNIDAYREVNEDLIKGMARLSIEGKAEKRRGGTLYLQGKVKLGKDVKIKGTVVIGEGASVGAGTELEDTVVGRGTKIGKGCKLVNSFVWWDVRIGDGSEIRRGVLCNEVKIGKGVRAREGVVIAEETEVGDNVLFTKDVIVWPRKVIEENSVVSRNVVWEQRWEKGLFRDNKVTGRINIELTPENATRLGIALGSSLPEKSTLVVSRDYHRASRTIKRAFLGGILSTGVNVIDLHLCPLPVMTFFLEREKNLIAGVHFSLSLEEPNGVEISFFESSGMPADTNFQKKVERIFFREAYRLEPSDFLGTIREEPYVGDKYVKTIMKTLDGDRTRLSNYSVVYDLLHSPLSVYFPEIFGSFRIDPILINSIHDERRLSKTKTLLKSSKERVSRIVKALSSDLGFVVEPGGEGILALIDDEGRVIEGEKLLSLFLMLLDLSSRDTIKVLLPVWAPEVIDLFLKNVEVERGKLSGLKKPFIEEFHMVGNTNGRFVFPRFSPSPDALFSSLMILEMLSTTGKKLSEIYNLLPTYTYLHEEVQCPSKVKGQLLRTIAELISDKEVSLVEGVKVYERKDLWVLILPDTYRDVVHLYVQSREEEEGRSILKRYRKMVEQVIKE